MILEVELISVPVLGRGEALGQVNVAVRLALKDPNTREFVRERTPKLRDAFFKSLYRDGGWGRISADNFDLDRVKGDFQKAADHILGAGLVEVLIHRAQLFLPR